MTQREWSGVPASRTPPEIDLSSWKKIEIGHDIYAQPILRAWWRPRPEDIEFRSTKTYYEAVVLAWTARKKAVVSAQKELDAAADVAYSKALAPATKAFDGATASTTAWKAFDEAVASANAAYDDTVAFVEKAHDEAIAYAAARHLFDPPAVEYVLYRADDDLWVTTDDAHMAGRLLVAAASELRHEHGEVLGKVERDREYARHGVTLARFDPRHVFVKRHERRAG